MKKIFFLLCIVITVHACSKGNKSPETSPPSNRITISGAWALYPLVVKWAELYQKQNPDIIIDISAGGAGKGVTDALSGVVDLGMVSRDINKVEIEKGAWWISVAKDAVIPMINDANPLSGELLKRGIARKEFAQIWITGTIKNWNSFIKTDKTYPLHVYTRSDACGASETWAKYVGGTQEDLKGIGVYGDPGLADAVRNDILGIGYNNVNFAYDTKTRKPIPGIRPVPIDINSSGAIEADEKFYDDRDSLIKAIADNKYPSPPARNLHLVSRGIPDREKIRRFLLWILGEGQRYVQDAGYICLPGELLKKQAEQLVKKQ